MKLSELESRLINALFDQTKSYFIDALEKKKDWNDYFVVGQGFKVPGTEHKTAITIKVEVVRLNKSLHMGYCEDD
jgi:hypothetical protein